MSTAGLTKTGSSTPADGRSCDTAQRSTASDSATTPRTAHHTGAKARRGREGVGTSPRAGVVETRVYVLVDTRAPLQGDHELFMRPEDLPVASLLGTRSHEGGAHARWPADSTC